MFQTEISGTYRYFFYDKELEQDGRLISLSLHYIGENIIDLYNSFQHQKKKNNKTNNFKL